MKDKIQLRNLDIKDAEFLLENLKDNTLLAGKGSILDSKKLTINDERKWIRSELKSHSREKFPCVKYIVEYNGVASGLIGIMLNNEDNMNCEVYYWISKGMRGKGLAVSALKQFLKKMKTMKYKRVEARVLEYNIASQKTLEKCGFKKEGKKIKSTKYKGKYYNDFIYGLVF